MGHDFAAWIDHVALRFCANLLVILISKSKKKTFPANFKCALRCYMLGMDRCGHGGDKDGVLLLVARYKEYLITQSCSPLRIVYILSLRLWSGEVVNLV